MNRLRYDSKTCPHCQANLIGPEIPPADQEMFGGKTHFSRIIGIYDSDSDMTAAWKCPDCGQEDSRW